MYKVTRAQGIIHKLEKIQCGETLPKEVHPDFIQRHLNLGFIEDIKKKKKKKTDKTK